MIDALKIHPNINASYNEETKEITYYDAEHLGFAVDTEQGLLSPVIHNAGDLSLAGLARAIADIAARPARVISSPMSCPGHVHDHQHRQPGRASRHADPGPASGRHARHRRNRQTAAGGRRRKRQRVDRDPLHLLSAADLRPPADRRRRRRTILDHGQASARRSRVRGRPRALGKAPWPRPSSRSPARRPDRLGAGGRVARARSPGGAHRPSYPANSGEVHWNPESGEFDASALNGVDAVVNLCGINIGQRRWSGAFKQNLRDSRITPTEVLAAAVAEAA
ncbi:2-oxoacid dehydrogenases acyltransferase family protein [Mycobacterium xenopi 3993]|nr:2-oxoacid dehydrogenases acyltransferase family protein [Mycobacterium xenopi 3993]